MQRLNICCATRAGGNGLSQTEQDDGHAVSPPARCRAARRSGQGPRPLARPPRRLRLRAAAQGDNLYKDSDPEVGGYFTFLSCYCWLLSARLHNRNIKWHYTWRTGFFSPLFLTYQAEYETSPSCLQTGLSARCGNTGKISDNATASLVFATSFTAAEGQSKP